MGAIWTNHALERLKERGLTQEAAGTAFKHPDFSGPATKPGSYQFQKKIGKTLVSVIAKKNEKNEWLILSAWTDPPLPGTKDEKRRENYRKYQKASFFKKILITFARQLGLSRY